MLCYSDKCVAVGYKGVCVSQNMGPPSMVLLPLCSLKPTQNGYQTTTHKPKQKETRNPHFLSAAKQITKLSVKPLKWSKPKKDNVRNRTQEANLETKVPEPPLRAPATPQPSPATAAKLLRPGAADPRDENPRSSEAWLDVSLLCPRK